MAWTERYVALMDCGPEDRQVVGESSLPLRGGFTNVERIGRECKSREPIFVKKVDHVAIGATLSPRGNVGPWSGSVRDDGSLLALRCRRHRDR